MQESSPLAPSEVEGPSTSLGLNWFRMSVPKFRGSEPLEITIPGIFTILPWVYEKKSLTSDRPRLIQPRLTSDCPRWSRHPRQDKPLSTTVHKHLTRQPIAARW